MTGLTKKYVIVNKTTNLVVFKGDMFDFKAFAIPFMWMMVPDEWIKNWAAANDCVVYERI